MDWHFEQKVDLQHPSGVVSYPEPLMTQGDHLAHTWRVQVYSGGRPMDLTGYAVIGYFDRSDGKMVPVIGSAVGHVASVVMPQSVYVAVGPLTGLLRAGKDGQIITLAAGRWNVRRGPGDEIVDPGHVVPSLNDLLAQIDEMEAQTRAASTAADKANMAANQANAAANAANIVADKVKNAASAANTKATAANTAARSANTAATNADTAARAASGAAAWAESAAENAGTATSAANDAAKAANDAAVAANTAARSIDAKVENAVAPFTGDVKALRAAVGDWTFGSTAVARHIDIYPSVPLDAGKHFRVEILEWTGDPFSTVNIVGVTESSQFVPIFGDSAGINVPIGIQIPQNCDYLRVLVNTEAMPTTPQTIRIKLTEINGESIASAVDYLRYNELPNAEKHIAEVEEEAEAAAQAAAAAGNGLSKVKQDFVDLRSAVGDWIFENTAVARHIDIYPSVPLDAGRHFRVEILEWTGDPFSTVNIVGVTESSQFVPIFGSSASINVPIGIQIPQNCDYLRVLVNTEAMPTTPQTIRIKLTEINGESIASAVDYLRYNELPNAEKHIAEVEEEAEAAVQAAAAAGNGLSKVKQDFVDLRSAVGDWIFENTAVARHIDIYPSVPLEAGRRLRVAVLEWTGDPFSTVSIVGVTASSQFVPIYGNSASINVPIGIQIPQNCDHLRVLVNTGAMPTTPQTLRIRLTEYNGESIASAVDYLRYNELPNAEKRIAEVEEEIEGIKVKNPVFVPDMVAVVGHEINIYYHNICKYDDISSYDFAIRVKKNGSYFGVDSWVKTLVDCIRITPTASAVGEYTVELAIRELGVEIITKQFNLKVVADNKPAIKAIFIGDSITQQGLYTAEVKELMGDSITMYGTRTSENASWESYQQGKYDVVVNHEGRGGWSTSDYCSKSVGPGNAANPFYNNGFDFSFYIENNPTFRDVTDVFINLGTNEPAADPASVSANLQTMINSIHSLSAGIRVHIGLPIPPAMDKYSRGSNTTLNHKSAMWEFCKYFYTHLTGCFFVPLYAVIDTWYGWSRTDVPVAAHLKDKYSKPTDWLHPSYGGWQMGDAVYTSIIAHCNS